MRRLSTALFVCLGLWLATASGQQSGTPDSTYVPDEVLVKFHPAASQSRRDSALASRGAQLIRRFGGLDLHHVRLPQGQNVLEAVTALAANSDVEFAQPNYIRHATQSAPPNDPLWLDGTLWGLQKIQAASVWSSFGAGDGSVLIADIDTGVNYNHPDLSANIWTNPAEIPGNGIDDDGNGYIDDVHGINVLTHSGDPMDDHGHGTHTSGTIAAAGNNATGVVGVLWNAKIVACKFLDAAGSGTDAGATECFNYIVWLKQHGFNIRVTSNSWGSTRGCCIGTVLKSAIDAAGNVGILNAFAAGNNGLNNDSTPFDPASFPSASIVSVAASDSNDSRASFSNYGATSVHLAAPGVSIASTYLTGYASMSGTSMATPHVAGSAALIAVLNPALTPANIKSVLMNNVDAMAQWTGLVVSGGRLNLYKAVTAAVGNTPPSVTLTSPATGSLFAPPATITVSANASDPGGSVSSVAFYANTTLIGTDTTSPYSITWSNVATGAYSVTAVATDNKGVSSTSSAASITVNTAPTVTLTSPAAGPAGNAPATVALAATASDSDGTISSVKWYANGLLVGTDTSAPYTKSWTNVAAGSYSITAVAMDDIGATTTSAPVAITVNAKPTVALTAPTAGPAGTAPATITVSASASDSDGTIASVAFFANGAPIGTDTTSPYSVSWANVATGSYSITAVATDNQGATTTSAAVAITVTSNTAPTVAITAPAAGPAGTAPATITVSANANDSDGTVVSVAFFANGTPIGTDTTSPFSVSWSNVAAGNYSLTAVATDNLGATTASAGVAVSVSILTASGTAAYWRFDEASGGTAADSSGNGNTGTLVGAPSWTGGQVGGAIQLTGSTQDVMAPNSPSVNIAGTGLTLAAWIYPTQASAGGIIHKDLQYSLFRNADGSLTYADSVTWSYATIGGHGATPLNTWSHVAVTFDGGVIRFYVNGQPAGVVTRSGSLTATTAAVHLGSYDGRAYWFAGKLDEPQIYNRTLSASEIVALQTGGQSPVTVTLTSPSAGAQFTAPATVTVTANASSTGGTIASVTFFANGTQIGAANTTPYTFSWTPVAAGSYSVTAVATDNLGATTTTAPVVISVNAKPTVALTAPAAGPAGTAPAAVTVSASASDSDGTIASVAFFANGAPIGTTTTSPYSISWTNVAAGSYSLTAVATDNWGATTTSAAVAITVATNTAPTVVLTAPAAGPAGTAPAAITVSANASDSDGTVASVAFFANGAPIGTDTTSPFSVSWTNVTAGNYSITAVATDNLGATTTSAPIAIAVNAKPTVALTAPAAGPAGIAPATITVGATASDGDGTIASVAFFANGTPIGTSTTAPYTVAWNSVAAGSYSLTAVATDNLGATTTSAAVAITVATNAAPTVALTAPAGGPAGTAPATVTVSASASDSDGTIASVAFFANGAPIGTDTTSPYSVSWTNVAAGSYSVTAVATDNLGTSTTSAPVAITVNAKPTVALTAPAAGSAGFAPAMITVSANASDSDGTIASVAFFANGTPIGTDTTSPFSVSWSNVAAGNYSLTAVATDNLGATTASAGVAVSVSILTASGTAAYWRFDEASGGTAADSSGNGNTGTLVGAPSWTGGQVGGAIQLTGSTQDVMAPNSPSVNIAGTGLTLAAWIYPTQASAGGIIHKDLQYSLFRNADGSLTYADSVTWSYATIGGHGATPLNTWSHVAVTFDGGVIRFYVNGQPAGVVTRSGSLTATTAAVHLGSYDGRAYWFAGKLDEPQIYNRTLSASEIVALQTGGQSPVTVTLTSPSAGAQFTAPATVTVTANASSTGGTIASVTFFANGTQIGAANTTPYTFSWTPVAAGSYSVTAVATDNLGATTTTAPVVISVNAKPTVALTAPAAGPAGTAPAAVTVSASASDSDGTIASVAFFANGAPIGTTTTSPYSISWTNVAAGSYSLTAVATDNWGATTTSAAVAITVNAKPIVALTAPAAGPAGTAPATITVSANASDSDGTIASVAFFANGTPIGTDTTSPFSVSWSNVAAGNYSLTAVATDNLGASTTSAGVAVSVSILTASGTAAYWRFDEASGGTAADSTGNGNTGTLVGAPSWTGGQVGGAIQLTGSTQDVMAPNSPSVNIAGTGLTLAAWIYPTQASAGGIIHKDFQYSLFRNADGSLTYADSVTWSYATIGGHGATPLNTWSHVAVTFDGGVIRFYVNGQPAGVVTRSGSLTATTAAVHLGSYDGRAYWFAGKLDGTQIFNRALSASEIVTLETSGLDTTPPALVAVSATAATQVSVTYSEPVTASTAGTNANYVVGASVVVQQAALQPDSKTVILTTTPLAAGLAYTLTVSNVQDVAGNPIPPGTQAPFTYTPTQPSGLAAHWGLDDGAGAVAADSSGNGNTGTLVGAPSWTGGQVGGAIQLTGSTQDVMAPNSPSVNIAGTGLTLAAWIYPTQASAGGIIHKDLQYSLFRNADGSLTYADSVTWSYATIGGHGATPLNTWSHVAVTFDGGVIRFYVNGQPAGVVTRSGSLTATTAAVHLGSYDGRAYWFAGKLDEPQIFNRALSAQEIATLQTGSVVTTLAPMGVSAWARSGARIPTKVRLLFVQESTSYHVNTPSRPNAIARAAAR